MKVKNSHRQRKELRILSRMIKYAVRCRRWIVTTAMCTVLVIASGGWVEAESVDGMSMLFGGCGGVYFYASPGELWVEVGKQDLNNSDRETHLRAVLFAPDRSVVDEALIADDGLVAGSGPGIVHRVRLRTNVERPGVYGMIITVSEDRYGEHMSWGFRTNCQHYLVETSRGHRDARHEEPLVMRNARREGDVCFMPQSSPFSIEVSGLTQGVESLPLYDAKGRTITSMVVSSEGTTQHVFPAEISREDTPWRLHLPKCQAVINIDGVTRWVRGEAWNNLSLWTPDISSWFPFHENRWLLWPYNRTVYAETGMKDTVVFTVHNNSVEQKRVTLGIEFDKGIAWPAELSTTEVTLNAYASVPVSLTLKVPNEGNEWNCYVRATVLDAAQFSTWSSVTLRRGTAPADTPVDVPIKLEPYRHENEQYGYLPDYPLDNQVYFDMENRPFIIANDGVFSRRDNAWIKTTTARRAGNGKTIPIIPASTKVAFDQDNDVYCVGRSDKSIVLLHSQDHGATFMAWPIPGSGSIDIEQFSGYNRTGRPPPLARFKQTAKDPKLIWRRINDLDLFLPVKKEDGSIDVDIPIPVSKQCIGLAVHSGIPSSMVSRGDKVHITWGEATDPGKNIPGVPTFVATYDRSTGKLGESVLVGYGPPANDIHNTPCITMDSRGYLHVLVGTHGHPFKYVRSLVPNSAYGGWTEAEDVGSGLRQTYVGMICGRDDILHLVFRLWCDDTQYFPAGHYATLSYMRKSPGQPWSDAQPIIIPPFSEYSIFYHRLTIDRYGTLFLSYDYWSTYWFYRTDHRGTRRSLLMSPDGGNTWKLAPSSAIIQR